MACPKTTPPGFLPCTRDPDHDGPCAHPPAPQKPSIGRIVIYRTSTDAQQDCCYPAIITRVWTDECVNLEVFGDESGPLGEPQGRFPTSVAYGTERRQWSWPPRV